MKFIGRFCLLVLIRIYTFALIKVLEKKGLKRSFGDVIIYGVTKDNFNEFSESVFEALEILKSSFPVYHTVVCRSLRCIIYQPRPGEGLSTYMHPVCFFRWNNFKGFSKQIQVEVLATIMVHEAYRAEYYRKVGFRAYRNRRIERCCMDRDIRMLKVFVDHDQGKCRDELERIIVSLES